MKTIALFDFDGTITVGDSFYKFLFYKKNGSVLGKIAMALPLLLQWKTGLIKNGEAKEKVFSLFFKGMEQQNFVNYCKEFADKILPAIVNDKAAKRLDWHRQQGHAIVIVSASIENYLQYFAAICHAQFLGTRVEVIDNKLTGNFNGVNCYGSEKVNRIKEVFDMEAYDQIYAYGDSSGDREMLAMATHPFYRLF